MLEYLQQNPRPEILADPIRAVLRLLDELHIERNAQLLNIARFAEGSEEVGNINLRHTSEVSFLPLFNVLEEMEREVSVRCGRIGISPQEVREAVEPAAGMIRTLLSWPRLLSQVRAAVHQLDPAEFPQFVDEPENSMRQLRNTFLIGRYWIAAFDPIRRRLLHFSDYCRGREEPLPLITPTAPVQPGEGGGRATGTHESPGTQKGNKPNEVFRDSPTKIGVRWKGREMPFDKSERRELDIVEAMWPPAQGKRRTAEEVKKAVGASAKHDKWAVNAASDVNKVLGKFSKIFSFKLIGSNEGDGYLQWEDVSTGTP